MITISPKSETPKKVERLTVNAVEAAEMLGISERTLWQWKRDNRIPYIQRGRRVLYSIEALRRFVNGNMANDNDTAPCDSLRIHAKEHWLKDRNRRQ